MGIGAGALVVGALGMNVRGTPVGISYLPTCANLVVPLPSLKVKNHMEDNNLAFLTISAAAVGISILLIGSGFRTYALFAQ